MNSGTALAGVHDLHVSAAIPKIRRKQRGGLPLLVLACTPLGGLTIAECDNEDQIRVILAISFLVGSSKLAQNDRQK